MLSCLIVAQQYSITLAEVRAGEISKNSLLKEYPKTRIFLAPSAILAFSRCWWKTGSCFVDRDAILGLHLREELAHLVCTTVEIWSQINGAWYSWSEQQAISPHTLCKSFNFLFLGLQCDEGGFDRMLLAVPKSFKDSQSLFFLISEMLHGAENSSGSGVAPFYPIVLCLLMNLHNRTTNGIKWSLLYRRVRKVLFMNICSRLRKEQGSRQVPIGMLEWYAARNEVVGREDDLCRNGAIGKGVENENDATIPV